jgi:hypothetical protein
MDSSLSEITSLAAGTVHYICKDDNIKLNPGNSAPLVRRVRWVKRTVTTVAKA